MELLPKPFGRSPVFLPLPGDGGAGLGKVAEPADAKVHPTAASRRGLSIWRAAVWLPLIVVTGIVGHFILTLELIRLPIATGMALPDEGRIWWQLELLWMSGGGWVAGWLLFLGWLARRQWPARVESWPEVGLAGMLAAAMAVLPMAGYALEQEEETVAWLLFVFAPTLGLSFGLVASGMRHVRRTKSAAALCGGLALANVVCQSSYGPSSSNDRQMMTAMALNSALIGLAVAIRLAIWGRTDDRRGRVQAHE